jgi:hypothetical protein
MFLETKKPPSVANEPVEMSTIKSTAVGAVELSSLLLQLDAKPAIQAGNNTVAAPNPTFAKNSFLFIISYF